MTDSLTLPDFQAQLDATFVLNAGDSTHDLRLIEVQSLSESARVPEGREPFSAIFLGPKEPIFGQQIVRLTHSTLGDLDLFLVPLGPDIENRGIRYEAVFS